MSNVLSETEIYLSEIERQKSKILFILFFCYNKNMKNTILLLMVLILFSACLPNNNITNTNSEEKKSQNETNEPIVCAQDVKHCPQGFYVSRTLPNCDFPACPGEIENKIYEPIAQFKERITKKPFGIYITPETSPVQPEKFTGYHTGVDVEYDDLPQEKINIYAIADGEIVRSGWVSGYGGMLAIRHKINDKNYIVIYGHLSPDDLPKVGTKVEAKQIIGYLGQGYNHDTDNERKHLHLAIYTGTDVNVRGYVANQTELAKWLDPVEFFN
ncbi:M23 family metallopeptidase [Candidatus Parcubacteria bacterium]|nr:MAG: M23 family metallopeptidase [Candidatus Parcubacteria bacterium]